MQPFLGEPLFEKRLQFQAHVIHFLVRAEKKGDCHHPEIGDDLGNTGHGKTAAVQLSDPQFSIHGCVIAHDAAGIDAEAYFSIGFFSDLGGKLFESVNPDRTFRRQAGYFEQMLWLGLQIWGSQEYAEKYQKP